MLGISVALPQFPSHSRKFKHLANFLFWKSTFIKLFFYFARLCSFGATELYSLVEYKVRSTSPFEKDYLLGKYGATPLIGEMESIFNSSKQ